MLRLTAIALLTRAAAADSGMTTVDGKLTMVGLLASLLSVKPYPPRSVSTAPASLATNSAVDPSSPVIPT
jgi:hypothetical protein